MTEFQLQALIEQLPTPILLKKFARKKALFVCYEKDYNQVSSYLATYIPSKITFSIIKMPNVLFPTRDCLEEEYEIKYGLKDNTNDTTKKKNTADNGKD